MVHNNKLAATSISPLCITLKTLANDLHHGHLELSIKHLNQFYNQLHYRYDQTPNKKLVINDTQLTKTIGTYATSCCLTHFYNHLQQQLNLRRTWIIDIPKPDLYDDINFQITNILLSTLKFLSFISKPNEPSESSELKQTTIGTDNFTGKAFHEYLDNLTKNELAQYQQLPKDARQTLRMALIPECPLKLPYDIEHILAKLNYRIQNAEPELKKMINTYLKLKRLHLNVISLHQHYFKYGEQQTSRSGILAHSIKLEDKTFMMLIRILALILSDKPESRHIDYQYMKLTKYYLRLKSEMQMQKTTN